MNNNVKKLLILALFIFGLTLATTSCDLPEQQLTCKNQDGNTYISSLHGRWHYYQGEWYNTFTDEVYVPSMYESCYTTTRTK